MNASLIDRRASAIRSDFEPTRPVFDLSLEHPHILHALALEAPQFPAAFESVRARIPLPQSAAASMQSHFYRLPNHNRSFCYSLAPTDSFFDGPVLVFKGAEPLLRDYPMQIDWMLQAPFRQSSRVMADHFPLAEGKIPGALSLNEATREAKIALEVQEQHLRHYGELARIPTPLLIHRISEEKTEECAALLYRKLSQPALERIEPLLRSGLAIYVYYYPSPPIRSNYWGGIASAQLTHYIQRAFNEETAASAWAKLTVRLFYLGYLPYSVRNDGLGACMDSGNATLDGGFCDPDSIIPIESSLDDEFLREGVIQSLAYLRGTIQLILGLANRHDLHPSIDEFVCRQYVHRLIDRALVSEARPQLHLDERIVQLFSPGTIADVRLCVQREKRTLWYTQFAKLNERKHRG